MREPASAADGEWDLIIVGAGAAGLLAAIGAGQRGLRTLLLEKNRKPGVKILMSGGTRCNVTHATNAAGIVEAFGKPGRFLHSALSRFGPDDVVSLLRREQVETKVEATGKVFPASDRALDVVQALLRRLGRSSCELAVDEPLLDVSFTDGSFSLQTSKRQLHCRQLILCVGGRSYPGCGTTGDGYAWARSFGHSVTQTYPALVPLTSHASWLNDAQGITVSDAQVAVEDRTIESPKRRLLCRRRGSLLFAHFGLSGPAAMDVSRVVSSHSAAQSLNIICDLLPDESNESLIGWLDEACRARGKQQLQRPLSEKIATRLGGIICAQAEVDPASRLSELSRAARRSVVTSIKRLVVPVSGTRGFKQAEVTAGGVVLSEINSSTMESKLTPNLFFAGEILDLDGPIGGYNFQAAFSTGWLAGVSAGHRQ